MAHSFDSNFTRKLIRTFLKHFDNERVLSKNVNTQLLQGKFDPSTGDTVDFKRPTDFRSIRTTDGDISSSTKSDVITGKASGVVQDYITIPIEFSEADESIKMDQLDQLLQPAARRAVTELELSLGEFMMRNSGLLAGTPGTAATTWNHVAEAGAVLHATGVPMDDDWCYTVNPYTQTKLASDQRSLGAGGAAGKEILTAHEKATLTTNYAGFSSVMAATTLPSYTTFSGADRAGTLSANPAVNYTAHKDTMRQTLPVTGFAANMEVKAGETLRIAGRNRLNLSTRKLILDDSGSAIVFTGVVNSDVTLDGSGAGSIKVVGPAIYQPTGAYNTVDSAPASGDVVTLLGSNDTTIQPNLFWHKQAFGVGFVPMRKLYATDTIGTTHDGIQIRVSKYSDGDANKQNIRFDLRPAFAAFNPFFAGHGFG